ncbi:MULTISPECIES: baseplate J/gp47 family protein [unclassified Ruminococcus]|uniref:baseplate J/gp47 family protein n=1 Tax=unclassified Ruminococcus TaxID=2608920 RepID=UPI00210F0119|nr:MULTISPECIES: baseplate J/gp47 family protein [unclassified Ruminococcus]MCQ4021535.1 hypothetical protein [Ruminococcus sp. zg-924]MCQ4113980.1 hypothetical protein [Ruminococcus sp. zg-921]
MESYNEIESRMFSKYKELTGCDCHDASDTSIKIKLLAGELFNLQSSISWLNNQLFPQTAAGSSLELHAQMRGLQRKAATKAQGKLKFSLPAAAESTVVIPAGTVCSTAGKNPVRFATNLTTSIGAGRTETIVNAMAIANGETSNVAPDTVCVITNLSNSLLSVTNPEFFSGGADVEDDDSLRRRIMEDINKPSTGTNKAYYKRLAQSVDGVYSANVVSRARGNGTVDIYIAAKGAAIDSRYVSEVQAIANREREINVDVLVSAATTAGVSVNLILSEKSGYDFNEVKESVIEKIKEYFASLQVGESVYVSSLGAAVASAQGVERFLFESSSIHNVSAGPSQLLTVGRITIEQG